MTNKIALALGIIIISALVIDVMLYGTEHLIFLGKKLLELLDWIAIWR